MLNPALFENMFKNKDLWNSMKVMGEIFASEVSFRQTAGGCQQGRVAQRSLQGQAGRPQNVLLKRHFEVQYVRPDPNVGLLFTDFATPSRLRVQGDAQLTDEPALVSRWPGVAPGGA